MGHFRVFAMGVALASLLIAGCKADGPAVRDEQSGPASATSTTAKLPSNRSAAVTTYFEAFATQDPEKMAAMTTSAVTGSFAARYASHQIAVVRAFRDAGEPRSAQKLNVSDDWIELCEAEPDPSDPHPCTRYANFQAPLGARQLSSFTINEIDASSRLILGGGAVKHAGGATFKLVSAYRSVQADTLLVNFEVVNTGSRKLSISESSSSYLGPAGRQSQLLGLVGPSDLRGGATALYTAAVQGGDVGGRLILGGHDEDYRTDFEVELSLVEGG